MGESELEEYMQVIHILADTNARNLRLPQFLANAD